MKTALLSVIALCLVAIAGGAAEAANASAYSAAGRVMLNPQPLPPGGKVMLNPQPLPPGGRVMLNPQPLPPRTR
jgi:hypothetical protein